MTRNGTGTHKDGYAQLPDLRLHYIDYGGSGETVIALHGFVHNARAFEAIVPALVPHVRLLALDLRGRGNSDWVPLDYYRRTNYLNDLHGFAQALGLSRFSMVGSSMGGTLALLYTMSHPHQVNRLVLNDTGLNADQAGVARSVRRITEAPAEFASLDEAIAWSVATRDGFERLPREMQVASVRNSLVATARGRLRFDCDPFVIQRARMFPPQVGPHFQPWSHRQTVWEQVERLTTPILLLRGAASDVMPAESARLMVELLHDARCVEIPGTGHAPTLYEQEAHEALRDFFGTSKTSGRQAQPNGDLSAISS